MVEMGIPPEKEYLMDPMFKAGVNGRQIVIDDVTRLANERDDEQYDNVNEDSEESEDSEDSEESEGDEESTDDEFRQL